MHQSSKDSQEFLFSHTTRPALASLPRLKTPGWPSVAGLRLAVVGLAVMVSGCGTAGMYDGYGVESLSSTSSSVSEVQRLRSQLTGGAADTAGTVGTVSTVGTAGVAINNSNALIDNKCFENTPSTNCNVARNNVVASLLIASDDMCQAHLKTIFGNEAAFNITAGTIAVMASGWATLTNKIAAKTSMAALSTFANAERSLVNDTVYKERMITAITTKIRQAREQKSLEILHHFNDNIESYPVMLALSDVTKYHYTCSFMYGLEKALDEGVQSSMESRKVKLEQEKQQLVNLIDARNSNEKLDRTATEGAISRVKEIDKTLQAMVTLDAVNVVPSSQLAIIRKNFSNAVGSITQADSILNQMVSGYMSKATDQTGLNQEIISAWKTSETPSRCSNKIDDLYMSEVGALALQNQSATTERNIKIEQSQIDGSAIASEMIALAAKYSAQADAIKLKWDMDLKASLAELIKTRSDFSSVEASDPRKIQLQADLITKDNAYKALLISKIDGLNPTVSNTNNSPVLDSSQVSKLGNLCQQ